MNTRAGAEKGGGPVFSCAMFLYLSAKMLPANKDPSRVTVAKTSLVQASKSKESIT